MNKKSNIWRSLYLTMGILMVLTHACNKESGLSTTDLLTAVKWEVTDVCGPVGDPYTYTFKPNGQLIQEQGYMNTIYSTWSLKNNDKVLVIGVSEEKIIALTETELKLKGYDLFDCVRAFKAIPF
jgi:hypothetical protein